MCDSFRDYWKLIMNNRKNNSTTAFIIGLSFGMILIVMLISGLRVALNVDKSSNTNKKVSEVAK